MEAIRPTLWLFTASLALGVFGATGVLPFLSSLNFQVFPTALRGEAYGWTNSGIGRIGQVVSRALLGLAAESIGWGAPSVRPRSFRSSPPRW